MRLLVDEMYPARLAEQLRRRGHDVVAVSERRELRGLGDAAVFAFAQEERRAIATENVVDFVPLVDGWEQRGDLHHGLVLIDPAKYPRGHDRTVGQLVRALEALLQSSLGDEANSLRRWL